MVDENEQSPLSPRLLDSESHNSSMRFPSTISLEIACAALMTDAASNSPADAPESMFASATAGCSRSFGVPSLQKASLSDRTPLLVT